MALSNTAKTRIQSYSKVIFCVLTWVFLLCIFLQIYYAGRAFYVDPNMWSKHLSFVNIFEFIPALMYIAGSAGWVPQKYKAWSMMLFILCNFQYYSSNWGILFHSIFALIILLISLYLVWGSFLILFKRKQRDISKKIAV